MPSLRSLTILGFFAAIGAALAIGLAVSSTPVLRDEPVRNSATMSRPLRCSAIATEPPIESCAASVHAERPKGPANAWDLRPTGIIDCVGSNKRAHSRIDTGIPECPGATASSSGTPQSLPAKVHVASDNPYRLAHSSVPNRSQPIPSHDPVLARLAPAHTRQVLPEVNRERGTKAAARSVDIAIGLEQLAKLPGQHEKPRSIPGPNALSAVAAPPSRDSGFLHATPPTAAHPTTPVREPVVVAQSDGLLDIRAQDTDIRELLNRLNEQGHLNIFPSKGIRGKVSLSLRKVDVEGALAAVLAATGYVARRDGNLVYVGTPKEIQEIRQSLDTVHTRIYRPNYVAATELRALIEPMLTDKVGSVSVSSPGGAGIESNASESGISPDCRDADLCDPQKGYAGGETVLVRDYESVLATLDRVVTEVDVHPMQVTVETTILSVELDGEHHFGVNFQALRGQTGLAASNPPANSPTNSRSEDSGLKIDFLDGGPASLIDALQQMGPTRVLAAPRLMVLDKHSAEILVGEESGCIKAIVAPRILPQNAAAMDTIARLRLRPVICSDGMIRLEVHPELCSGDVQDSAGAAVPRKQLMQVTTEIMVRDGRTLVLRGLLRDERSTASSKVPVLGQLPLIGRPFRKTTVITRRFELMAVITPHVVRDRDTHEVSEPHRSKAAMPATAADPRVQYVQSLLADSEARARETTGAHK